MTRIIEIPSSGGLTSPTLFSTSSYGAIDDADLSQGSVNFGTDNTTVLQNLLDEAINKPINIIWDGKYSVTGLKIRSNTTIICSQGCGAILRNHSSNYLLQNYNLTITETDYDNTDVNIKIQGGIWNGNGYNTGFEGSDLFDPAQGGSNVNGSAQYRTVNNSGVDGDFYDVIGMKGVSNLIMRDNQILGGRNFGLSLRLCQDFYIENTIIDFGDSSSRDEVFYDGIHFFGLCRNGTITGTRITNSFDDPISLVADGTNPDIIFGDITNISIINTTFFNTAFAVRLMSDTNLIDNINIDGIHGDTRDYAFVFENIQGTGVGNIGTVNVSNVSLSVTDSPTLSEFTYMKLNGRINVLNISNWTRTDFTKPYSLIECDNDANIRTLNLSNLNYYTQEVQSNNMINVNNGAFIANLQINGGSFISDGVTQNTSLININTGGILEVLSLQGVLNVNGFKNILENEGTVTSIFADTVRHAETSDYSFNNLSVNSISVLSISSYRGSNLYNGDFSDITGSYFNTMPSYTASNLPQANLNVFGDSRMIYVSDEIDGAVPCFTDGVNWRRFTDREIVSSIFTNKRAIQLTQTSQQYALKSVANGVTFGNSVTDSPFSVSIRIKVVDTGSFHRVLQVANNPNEYWYGIQFRDTGKIRFLLYDSTPSNIDYIETNNTFNFNQIYDLVCTYSGVGGKTGLKIYVDDVEESSTQFTFGSYTAMHGDNGNQNLQVGGIGSTGFEATFNGDLNDVVIWDKELSTSDVSELWDSGSREFDINTHSSWISNAISGYKFNNNYIDEKNINNLIGVNSPIFVDM